jgi:hypothetical protein
MEHTKHRNYPPNDDENTSFERNYAGTFVSRRRHSQQETKNQTNEPEQHWREIMPPELDLAINWFKRRYASFKEFGQDHNRIVAWFTVGIFIATTIYAFVAWAQWRAMRDSNEINRESMESVQRAFVSFKDFADDRITGIDGSSHFWEFMANFENNGNTVAQNAVYFFDIDEIKQPMSEETFIGNSNLKSTDIPPRIPIGIGRKQLPEVLLFGIDLGPIIRRESVDKATWNRSIVAWGWVRYEDAFFPRTPVHVVEFCYLVKEPRLRIDVTGKGGAGVALQFDQCGSQHNCQDHRCKDYERIAEIKTP